MAALLPDARFAGIDVAFLAGVSGGAINTGIIARALNRYDDPREARLLASTNLNAFWKETTWERFCGKAVSEFWNAVMRPFTEYTLPPGSPWQKPVMKSTHQYLRHMIESHLPDDNTLQWQNTNEIIGTTTIDELGFPVGHSHVNSNITLNTRLGSAAIRGVFPSVLLNDGRYHMDGAYAGNPIVSSVADYAADLDAVVWVHCNSKTTSTSPAKGLHLHESWECVEHLENVLPSHVPVHHVSFNFNLSYYTRLFPTGAQSDMLWQKGASEADVFLNTIAPQIQPLALRPQTH